MISNDLLDIIEISYDVSRDVTLLLGLERHFVTRDRAIFILSNKFYSSVLDSSRTLNCMKAHLLLGRKKKIITYERKKNKKIPRPNDASRCFVCIVTKYTMIHYYKLNRSRVSPMHTQDRSIGKCTLSRDYKLLRVYVLVTM